ncbi:immunoglobulin E-set domain-containing protein [Heterostelium album PN500]|uniref:Immunoglobulin E-set domain-containing protein n=1 Tax=Heterostelium pallidum (strain ATCC 26659 / Pp 5 / PN500) TaxID=670386 RepID=D3AVL7_HETP5|nr:immunoglobulin E-set domain-containing protein [Heterostelium album PN500]EFA86340.1 immunoglobulin E-set domain-containing protein [Heterostelium album PN500]|eukprot:XP_020438445.1 immunoglobulin E-set domain-containing protein [Heterostelium album PN500]
MSKFIFTIIYILYTISIINGQVFGPLYTKNLIDGDGVAVKGIFKAEFSPDYALDKPLKNLVILSSDTKSSIFRSTDNTSPLSNQAITTSLYTMPQYNNQNQAIAVYPNSTTFSSAVSITAIINFQNCNKGNCITSIDNTGGSAPKTNPILRWIYTNNAWTTVFTLFGRGATTGSLMFSPYYYQASNTQYYPTNDPAILPVSVPLGGEVDFLVYDTITDQLYLSAIGTVTVYKASTKTAVQTFTFANTGSKTAIAYNSTLYACTTNGDGTAYIEKINFAKIQKDTYTLSNDVSYCLNMNFDKNFGQLFVSVADSNGNLALITMSVIGMNPTILKISPSEAVNTNSLSSYSYAVGVDNDTKIVSVASAAGKLYSVQYTNLCPNQCSNHGVCIDGVCTCQTNWFGLDCGAGKPSVTSGQSNAAGSTQITYYGTTSITLSGENFANTTNYQITICNQNCTSMSFSNSSSISCSLYLDGTQNMSPLATCDVLVTFNSLSSDPVTLFTFASPLFTGEYTQTNNIITLKASQMYSVMYLVTLWKLVRIPFSVTPNSLSFTLPPLSTNSKVQVTFTNGQVYADINIVIMPNIVSVSHTVINTNAGLLLTMLGDFFLANPGYKIKMGDALMTPNIISMSELTFTTPQGIQTNKTIRAVDTTKNLYSNFITFQYTPPKFSALSFNNTVTNIITIQGNNFGNSSSLINITDTQSNPLNATILSVSDYVITAQLSSTISKGVFTLAVDSQIATSPIKLNLPPSIISIESPPVTGGNITIVGNYLQSSSVIFSSEEYDEEFLDCIDIGLENYPATRVCEVFSGVGEFEVFAQSIFQGTFFSSSSKSSIYQGPTIEDINPKFYFENKTVEFTITGDNFVNSTLVITVNDEECVATDVTTTSITCSITPSSVAKNAINPVPVFVSVKDQGVFNNNTLSYYEKECLNNCSTHGTCNYSTAICKCDDGYQGTDCSELIPTTSTTSTTTATTTDTTSTTTTGLNSSNHLTINILISILSLIAIVLIQ